MQRFSWRQLAVLSLLLLACSAEALTLYAADALTKAQALYYFIQGHDYPAVGVLAHPDTQSSIAGCRGQDCDMDQLETVGLTLTNQYLDICFQPLGDAWGLPEWYNEPTPEPGTPTPTPVFVAHSTFQHPSYPGVAWVGLQFYSPTFTQWFTGCCIPLAPYDDPDEGAVDLLVQPPAPEIGACTVDGASPCGYVTPICLSGITPTPTPTPTPTNTPTPSPGDGYEDDTCAFPPYDPHSAISVGETQWRSLEPDGDVDCIHLWVWTGLHVEILTHDLGPDADTYLEVLTAAGTYSDDNGNGGLASRVEFTSTADEVVNIRVSSANGLYGPNATYGITVNQLP